MDQPFFTLTVLFILHGWPLFILTALPQEAILALSRGVWIGRERAASLGSGHERRKRGCRCGRAGSGTPTVGLPEEALWEVWKEREPAAQGRDGQVGRELQGFPAGTDLSPAACLPTSLPCMTCPTLEHQTLFCCFFFMQLIKVGSVACALPWPWEPVPGESSSVGRPEGRPSATGCPQKPAFLEHSCEYQELTSQRRPSRFPGSLVPLLPEQPGGRACMRGYSGGCSWSHSRHVPCLQDKPAWQGAAFPNPGLFSSLIYQSSLGASWDPSVPPAKECFLPTSKRSPSTSFPAATSCAGPAWVRSSAPCP